MKLYLSSQKLGNQVDHLIALCKNNKRVAIIANGLDDKTATHRNNRVAVEIERLKSIGFIPEELDLRDYFGNSKALESFLSKKSMVWVRGGSAFILNRAMIQSGFSKVGVAMIKRSDLVYAGYSAALIVASVSLSGAELVDDPYVVPERYASSTNPFSGLGLIDFYLIPHIETKESWAEKIPLCARILIERNLEVVTLKDGEVYIVDGDNSKILK